MYKIVFLFCLSAVSILAQPATGHAADASTLRQQVMAVEAGFARSMAERNLAKFETFVAEDAVFFSKGGVLRGKKAIMAEWAPRFAAAEAPFSWAPETVEVLESGDLALSSGPVFDPSGKKIATFTSIWKLQKDGRWLIVFDKGNPVCP
jgi:ketosteroid isomerase-like protein